DDDMTKALLPTVEQAINISVRKDPQVLVDAIFPVIGPAIRRASAAALSGMTQSLNQTLAYSLSPRGLKWRLEAFRTGKSFAELVLLHTLRYRVEQVFLIHRETGLLLQHVVADSGGAVQDADMVSGMLTAIQDFARDSFNAEQSEHLENFQVGELTVWVEQGPLAILAGVIRGTAPQELRTIFQHALEKIHLRYHGELSDFSGDAEVFESARPILEDCLDSQFNDDPATQKRKPTLLIVIACVIIAALLALVFFYTFFYLRNARRWDAYVERLKNQPGIVVTETDERDGKYFVRGLRDPLAVDPQTFLPAAQLDPAKVSAQWQPYQALTPDFVEARASALLQPPDTVALKMNEGGVLSAEGAARHDWIVEARRAARFIPGVSQFREDQLFDTDTIEKQILLFELDGSQLVPGQEEKFRNLVAEFERLSAQARSRDQRVRVEITGRTDRTGSEERNAKLSQERAAVIAAELNARLPARDDFQIVAAGTRDILREELTAADRAVNRSVTFKIILSDAR
ncbi:MAG: OmpA family protein, partial [Acidobacteriota bacterium]|nr:OmpA family protein [Acidobacteriota bacterium]